MLSDFFLKTPQKVPIFDFMPSEQKLILRSPVQKVHKYKIDASEARAAHAQYRPEVFPGRRHHVLIFSLSRNNPSCMRCDVRFWGRLFLLPHPCRVIGICLCRPSSFLLPRLRPQAVEVVNRAIVREIFFLHLLVPICHLGNRCRRRCHSGKRPIPHLLRSHEESD